MENRCPFTFRVLLRTASNSTAPEKNKYILSAVVNFLRMNGSKSQCPVGHLFCLQCVDALNDLLRLLAFPWSFLTFHSHTGQLYTY